MCFDEIFYGIILVKLNCFEDYQLWQFCDLIGKFVIIEVCFVIGVVIISGLIDIMVGLGFFGVFFYGGLEIIVGEKIIGEFMMFFIVFGFVFEFLCCFGVISG